MAETDLLEAAREGVNNLAHCVMAVGWVDGQPVALAAQVGQTAGEDTALAAGLCNHTSTKMNAVQGGRWGPAKSGNAESAHHLQHLVLHNDVVS